MGQVFLSHVEEDFDVVQQIANGLEEAGYTTWYHERDSKVGSFYLDQVDGAIEECNAFLLLVSPHTLADPYQVDAEVVMAFESRKRIYPVLVDVRHDDFKSQRRSWWRASRGAVSLGVSPDGVSASLPAIVEGLKQLKIEPEASGSVTEKVGRREAASRPIRIFISYQRADAAKAARHIHAKLVKHFGGKEQVFEDVSSIMPGVPWGRAIDDAVGSCDVFLVLIGSQWLTAADDDGARRIDDEGDRHRREIEVALDREIPVLPVLIDEAVMPREEQLPGKLKTLQKISAQKLDMYAFESDVEDLIAVIEKAAGSRAMAAVEVREADITKLEVDAIASSANRELGGVVADVIARAGGSETEKERVLRAPLRLGEAVETTAGDMPAKWVIHAATIPPSADIIRVATRNALTKADQLGAKSLALLAFGTGGGGFSFDEAARIEVEEVKRYLAERSGLELVVFAVRGEEARSAFERAIAQAGL